MASVGDIKTITLPDGNTYDIRDTNAVAMTGATASSNGASGLVPAPTAGDNTKFLRGDGTWEDGGKPMVILSYGSSTWNDFINAYNSNVIVYCRASSNSNPATGSQTRMAFMAYVNNATTPTEVEFQYYRSVSSHSASQQGDQVFVYKLTSSGTWTVTTREAMAKIVAGTNLSSTYSNNVLTINGDYQAMTGASSSAAGETGLVPAPSAGDEGKYLRGDGTWNSVDISDKADKADTVLTTTLSRGRKSGMSVGTRSFAFGDNVTASGTDSFAQGSNTTASEELAHAEGRYTVANGYYSHAEGNYTTASGMASHAEGTVTTATHANQHVFGEYNVEDGSSASAVSRGNYVEIVGNGTGSDAKSNARSLDWDGNEYLKGDLYVGCGADSSGGTKIVSSTFEGATSSAAGSNGYVPAPSAGDQDTFLKGDGTWSETQGDAFAKANDLNCVLSDKVNAIKSPYAVEDVIPSAMIFNNGTIVKGSYNNFVSPLISVTAGTYGLKVIHDSTVSAVGNINTGNNGNNGFGFFAADGETVVTRPSLIQSLGNDIYLIEVPAAASYVRFGVTTNYSNYVSQTLPYFNQWILLPNADSSITDDFFVLAQKKADGVIDKLYRADGSKLVIKTMTGATSSADGKAGFVPAPSIGDNAKFLRGDGTWADAGGTVYGNTIDMSSTDDTKVSEAIGSKAPAIIVDSEKAFSHEGLSNISKITFHGNAYAFENCRYANKKNLAPTETNTYTSIGVEVQCAGHFIIMNGTGTSTGNTNAVTKTVDLIPAGNYVAIIDVDANGITLIAKSFEIVAYYTDDTSETFSTSISDQDATINMTFSKDVNKIRIRPGIRQDVVYTDYTFWVGIFPADVEVVDTELTVQTGSTVDYIAAIADTVIDTMQHESVVSSVADTKEYIDNHIPVGGGATYLTPEMYGAVGDDVTDDTTALQDCIDDSILKNIPIRGFGRYKITSTISIDGSYLDMAFNYIRYTGSVNAVTIAGFANKIWIGTLYASATGAEGIHIVDPAVLEATERLIIEGIYWYASGVCVKTISDANHMMYFIVLRIKSIMSGTSDCITSSGIVTELAVYDARFGCTQGWCFNGTSVKLFNCTMESNCWAGVYAKSVTIQNCRARELMDCLMRSNAHHDDRSGILFKLKPYFTGPQIQIHIDDAIYYDTIDLSEAVVPNDGTGSNASHDNGFTGYVSGPIIYGDLTYEYGEFILGKEMILHGKDKICVPQFESVHTISATPFDLRDATYLAEWDETRPPYPTKFIVNVADCVIYLSPSYCSEGYSEFTVDMTNYMATIYDRRGNVLFNPANYTNGVYKFSAIVDHTIDDVYQSDHSGQYVYPINSGYSDVWNIKKFPTITQVSGNIYQAEM